MSLVITIDGIPVGGLCQASITSTNYFSSDSFSVDFVADTSPEQGFAWWAELSDAYMEIAYIDEVESPSLVTLITGNIDSLTANPIQNIVSVEGRDLSACLIDSYLQQDFVNQTASEVVQTIAGQYGLVPQVTTTSDIVGRYFGDGYTKLSLGQFSSLRSNWDLVVQLAREADFDIFVQGQTLIFQPSTSAFDPAVVIGRADVTAMRIERTLAIEASAKVRVQSWNSQKMASYRATRFDGGPALLLDIERSNSQTYLFSRSNLTPVQADLLAQRYASEIGRLRTVLHVDMPWDLRFSPRSLILLQGTDSSFDGLYQVECLERYYNSNSGSSQTVRAVSWPVPS